MKRLLLLACSVPFLSLAADLPPVDDARAERLAAETLAKMTLEEKVSLCGACATMYLNAIPRVGIDREWGFSDCSHTMKPEHLRPSWGYVSGVDDRSTALPAMSALAATWNPALASAHGHVMGEQMRARDKSQMLGPAVNIMRNPLSGRNWEYLSEDPALAAAMAGPLVAAVQSHGVAATVKHFCLNSQELARFTQVSTVDTRTLEEIYLPAFAAAVRDGGALSVMMAYVRLNGIYCSENPFLQKEVLRSRWGFKGAIVTDWGGQHSCENAVMNGGGIECNFGKGVTHLTDFWGAKGTNRFPLATAVREGRVPAAVVDEMALNTLYMMARTGFLTGEQDKGSRLTDAHKRTAQAIGEEAIVLAKNAKGVLPLDRAALRRVVVFGQVADRKVAHLGSSCECHPEHEISLLDGLRGALGEGCRIETYPLGGEGCAEALAIDLLSLTTFDPKGKDAFIERAWERRQFRGGKEYRFDYVRATKAFWNVASPAGSGARREVGDEFVWTSSVEIRETGDYDFIADQGDTSYVTMSVNGRELVPWRLGSARVTVRLEKGMVCPVRFGFRLGTAENRVTFGWIPPSSRPAPLDSLRETCRTADAVLVFTGTTMGFGRAKESEGADRPDMRSADGHDEAIATILSWGNPRTVVVNRSGSPLEQPWAEACDTYLYLSYLGQEAGVPFARVLFGEANPSGKMPFTWPRRWADTAIATLGEAMYNPSNCVYLEGVYVGYRWYEKRGIGVQFPFGHGLSYTAFDYGAPVVKPAADGWTVRVPVTNAGRRAGKEVVQLYVRSLDPRVDRPVKELKGFAKVSVAPGETVTAEIPVRMRDLARFDPLTMRFRTDAGRYRFELGSSSADIRGSAEVSVAADRISD